MSEEESVSESERTQLKQDEVDDKETRRQDTEIDLNVRRVEITVHVF